ncbi:hypothetical protein Ac2012v2_006149 [Leucoagaricus gongylophorus]
MSSLVHYLRSAPILPSENPQYDVKGRQLPFQESTLQRHERHAFLKASPLWRRNAANWVHDQRSAAPGSSSASSSESPSPRTPASPLNLPHTHADTYTPHEQRMKLQTAEVLDAELQKLILASHQIHPPQHRQSRNYKNLHLPNTSIVGCQSKSPVMTSPPQRVQALTSTPAGSIFDSPSHPVFSAYPSRHINAGEKLVHEEPYIIYSSSHSGFVFPSIPTTNHSAAGIGEFPYPASASLRSPFRCRSLPSPLTSPSSSSFPRTLTPLASCAGSTSPKPRTGDH